MSTLINPQAPTVQTEKDFVSEPVYLRNQSRSCLLDRAVERAQFRGLLLKKPRLLANLRVGMHFGTDRKVADTRLLSA